MTRRNGTVAGLLLLAAGLLGGCSSKPVIGVLLPTTGVNSDYGESIESGARLAVTRAREEGAYPNNLEIVWADTASDPEKAVADLRQMVKERNVSIVIGGATSAEARALIPVLDELNVICVSPSASAPGLSKESPLFYRIYPSDEFEANTAAQFLVNKLGVSSVLIFIHDSDYSLGIEPRFVEQFTSDNLKGKVIGKIEVDQPGWQERAKSVLTAEKPPAVYIVGYAEETLEVLRLLRGLSYPGRIVATSAFDSTRVLQQAGSLADGVMFPLPPFDRTSDVEPVRTFVKRYLETYQRPPDILAAHGYDAMRTVIRVVKVAKPPVTSELTKALHFGLQDVMGVTGAIQFDDYGDVKHNPIMFICDGGQVLTYERYLKMKKDEIFRKMQDLLLPKS